MITNDETKQALEQILRATRDSKKKTKSRFGKIIALLDNQYNLGYRDGYNEGRNESYDEMLELKRELAAAKKDKP